MHLFEVGLKQVQPDQEVVVGIVHNPELVTAAEVHLAIELDPVQGKLTR